MSKQELAWLVIRVLGIVCLCVAIQGLIGAAAFAPEVVSAYRDLSPEMNHQLYHAKVDAYWTMLSLVGSQVLSTVIWVVLGLYCLRRGKLLHQLLVR